MYWMNFACAGKQYGKLIACTFLALFSSPASCGQHQETEKLIDLAQNTTGGNFCSTSKVNIVGESDNSSNFNLSRVWVSASPDICATWPDFAGELRVISGQVNLTNSKIPLLFYTNESAFNRNDPIERVIIRTVGGPGEAIGPYGYEAAYFRNISNPTVMVSLGYSGTAHNSRFPEENMNLASQQISQFVESLCRKMPKAHFLLIGESLGGPITISAYQEIRSCHSRIKLLLVSPMVDSVNGQILYSEQGSSGQRKGDILKVVRVNGNAKAVSARELITNFVPYNQRDISLRDRISRTNEIANNIWYIFGSQDLILNPDTVKEFIRDKSERTVMIEGMGHVSGPSFERAIAKTVEEIFDYVPNKVQ